ncbi:MAG: DsbA family protein [Caulobacteraceae bacterium]|nr:DsbA family protein [Caulobacteraceae bacterium]
MRSLATRLALMALLTFGLAACHPSSGAVTADDMSLGNPNAKVTVVEYASAGCPVCARWNGDVWPAFKTKYIDTGRIHYVFREMLVGGPDEQTLGASGFLLARCAGKDKYFPVVDAVFHAQPDIYEQHQSPRDVLLKIAQSVGMNESQFDACLNDNNALLALNQRSNDHATQGHIEATPTFVINGKALEPGYHPLTDLDAAISSAQAQ